MSQLCHNLKDIIGTFEDPSHDKIVDSLIDDIVKIDRALLDVPLWLPEPRTYTLVQLASVTFDCHALEKLLDNKANVNVPPTVDSYFLPLAIMGREHPPTNRHGQPTHYTKSPHIVKMTKLLIDHGADPNVISDQSRQYDTMVTTPLVTTPLGCMVMCKNYELAEMLLCDAHADPNLFFGLKYGTKSLPPLNIAEDIKDERMILLLKKYGARSINADIMTEWTKEKEIQTRMQSIYTFILCVNRCRNESTCESPLKMLDDYSVRKIIYHCKNPLLKEIRDGHYDGAIQLYA